MIVSLIFAFARDKEGRRVIGKDNKLPWKSSADMKRFKEYTSGHPVIMGRKTHESIGRILPGRENIIITRQEDFRCPGAHVVKSVEESLEKAGSFSSPEVFVIGGEEIYKQTLEIADRLYITEIRKLGITGDSFFPPVNMNSFVQICTEDYQEEFFAIYQRKEGTVAEPLQCNSYLDDGYGDPIRGVLF